MHERVPEKYSARTKIERGAWAGHSLPSLRQTTNSTCNRASRLARAERDPTIMFITIAAVVICVCVAVLPAAAELRRITDERDNPTRLLKIPTRRAHVEAGKGL
ncbi:hypothetical protein [Enhygromyxa salina]|uniref:hypothetical protein n=1 Tax=Enhygromyxa salina TaxID=215803 RepID=UPI0011BAE03D|nr:hypothetical protein [Enhygromyxa salina]